MKINKTWIVIIIVAIVLASGFWYFFQGTTLGAIAWDMETSHSIDGEKFPLNYQLTRIKSNYHWNCWKPYGFRAFFTFTDPDGQEYGEYSGSLTWPYEQWPVNEYPIINVYLTLDVRGTWTIYGRFEEKLASGWEQCGTKTGTFWVGDPTTCYTCDGYDVISQEYYSETCPEDWTPEIPDCGTPPITCYQCIEYNLISEIFEGECPEGWFDEPQDCGTPPITCYACNENYEIVEREYNSETCPEGWFEEPPICEEPEPIPGFELIGIIISIGAILLMKRRWKK